MIVSGKSFAMDEILLEAAEIEQSQLRASDHSRIVRNLAIRIAEVVGITVII